MSDLTLVELKEAVPKNLKSRINQQMVNTINAMVQDPEERERYRDNIISYASVMEQGRFKLGQYLDAVRYVSYKLMGENNTVAYKKTFQAKYVDFKQRGVDDKTIGKYIYAYNKSKLVNLIWEQSAIPFYVLNQDARQKALNHQVYLMEHAKSEKVQSDAADSIMKHTAPPKEATLEIEVAVKDTGVLANLEAVTRKLAEQQHAALSSGSMSAKEVAHQGIIIEGEVSE